jgi:hypothetical protein
MRFNLRAIPPEIIIAAGALAIMGLFSLLFALPIVAPSGDRAAFVGVHFLYPLVGVALLGAVTFIAGKRETALSFLIALPCYVVILFAHFNLKLWIPHINPVMFDEYYWATDQFLRPVVDACIYIRQYVFGFISYNANFYMISFMALFYTSFLYHAIKTPAVFRTLAVAVLLLQATGALAYLIAPAIGPFIYETGVEPSITIGQLRMLEFYHNSLAGGPAWLAEHGGASFTIGLAAMPSLHAAGAFLFFLFAWKHGRILLPLYSLILVFILVTSIASRWHYVVDVPMGIALAWACLRIAERITGKARDTTAADPAVAALPAAA